MPCSSLSWAAAGLAMLASVATASPTPVDVSVGKPINDLHFREALEVAHTPHLEKRLSADFSMDKTWDNDVLFSGSWMNSDGDSAEKVSLSITCVECYTKGTVTATLTDSDIVDPAVRLDFSGVEAYVDIELAMSAGATYAVNLFATQTPIGLGFPGLSVGVVFYVDLIFSLTEEIDLEGGFYVKLADGSYLEASVFGGDITKSLFDGISTKSLPVTVKSGMATFKADLRLRVQCGAEADIDIFGIGAGAELGIYANLIEFVAVLDSTPTCELQTLEWFDLNVGAFAHLDVVVDWKTIGAIPTISTTLLTAPTLTQCWIQGGSPSESGAAPTVTVSASIPPAERESKTLSISAPSVTMPPQSSGGAASSDFGASGTSTDELVTSTLYTTTTFTITSCAASVVNCPKSYASEIVVTQTIDIYTTVCPVTASITAPASSSSAAAVSAPVGTTTVVTDVIVLVPCSSAIVETFTPPGGSQAPAPTTTPAAAAASVPPVEQEVTATVVPAPKGSASATATARVTTAPPPSSSPFVGGPGGGAKAAQWGNSTSCSTTLSSAPSAGLPGAHTTTAAPTFATAGAAATGVRAGLVVLAAVFGGFVLM